MGRDLPGSRGKYGDKVGLMLLEQGPFHFLIFSTRLPPPTLRRTLQMVESRPPTHAVIGEGAWSSTGAGQRGDAGEGAEPDGGSTSLHLSSHPPLLPVV